MTLEELKADKAETLAKANALTSYIQSDDFHLAGHSQAEQHYMKKREAALLEYHMQLTHQIAVIENPSGVPLTLTE